jgi:hypothetical protein
MKRIRTKTIRLVLLLVLTPLAILAFSCAASPSGEQQEQSRHDFLAVLIDTASKKPVPSARIILAPKKEGKLECTIDTSLTGISNDHGEVRIQNVKPGEYVVFYNVSGILHAELNGKVVNYDRVGNDSYATTISRSLGPLLILKGSEMGIVNGLFCVNNGHMYAVNSDLAMISSGGKLLKVSVPGTGSAPVKIEIHTEIGK